tara:strand:+ start:7994 stop:10855 length:2862 start_codon:yes stop_codon:yes gene_type:complete
MAVTMVLPVRAQSVTDFDFCADVSVLNNTGATMTNQPVRAGVNTLNYTEAGFLNATATDMQLYNRAGTTIVDMTAQDVLINDSSYWVHVKTVADGSSVTDTLCTGSTVFTTRDNGFGLYGSSENITVTGTSGDSLGDLTIKADNISFYAIGAAEAPIIAKAGVYELGVKSANTIYARVVDTTGLITAEAIYSPIAVDTEYDITVEITAGSVELLLDGVSVNTASVGFTRGATANDILMGAGFTGYAKGMSIQGTGAFGGLLSGIPTVKIAEECLATPAATKTFTLASYTIPVAAKHLVLTYEATGTRAAGSLAGRMYFNGDTSAIYNTQSVYGYSATIQAARVEAGTNADVGWIPGTATPNVRGVATVLIPEYANTARDKNTLSVAGNGEDIVGAFVTRTALTDAITSVTFRENGAGNIDTGSCFTLAVVDERYNIFSDTLSLAGTLGTSGIAASSGQLFGIGSLRSTAAGVRTTFNIEFNGDTTVGNYAGNILRGQASSASGSAVNNFASDITASTATANAYSPFFISISQFAAGTQDPHYVALGGFHESTTPVARVDIVSGRRNNVEVINEVAFGGGTNFEAGSSMWLYSAPSLLIERVTVGPGGAGSIAFNTIPQDREALTVNLYARSTTASATTGVNVELNGDSTAANYNLQMIDGDGSTASASQSAASQQVMEIPAAWAVANIFGGGIASFGQYAGTVYEKTILAIEGAADDRVGVRSMRWENTSGITDITLTPGAGNFAEHTVAELWGFDEGSGGGPWAVDYTFGANEISQTDAGDAGDGWTWEGTVADQSAYGNTGVYTLVRDPTSVTVTVGPAVAASILTTTTAAETDPALVSGDPNPGFGSPYVEGTTPASFSWPLSIVANINTGVTDGYPLQLLAWSLALIVGLAVAFGAYRMTKIIAWTIIASVGATSLIVFMTPIANVIIMLMAGTAVVSIFLIPRSWETQ